MCNCITVFNNGHALFPASRALQGWQSELEDKLRQNSSAIVGECGLDRVARVPGTGAETDVDHQWDILREHMRLATRYARPVRVRVYGAVHARSH